MTLNELDRLYEKAANAHLTANIRADIYHRAVMLRMVEEVMSPMGLWWEETGKYLPSCGAKKV